MTIDREELRRIVETATRPVPDPLDCPLDGPCMKGHHIDQCPWLTGMDAQAAARSRLLDIAPGLLDEMERLEKERDLGNRMLSEAGPFEARQAQRIAELESELRESVRTSYNKLEASGRRIADLELRLQVATNRRHRSKA